MNKDEYKKLIKEAFSQFLDETTELTDNNIKGFHERLDKFFGGFSYEDDDGPVIQVLMRKIKDQIEGKDLPLKLEVTFKVDPQMLALIKQLPDEGPAPNLKLELVRAFNKIVWDFMNNGFGNSWAKPLWLLELCGFDAGNFSIEYSFGIPLKDDQKVYDSIRNELYDLQKQVLKIITNHPEYENIHGVDMWNEKTFRLIGNDEVNTYKYYFNPGMTDCLEAFSGIDFDILMNALRDHEDILCKYPKDYSYGSEDEYIKESLNCEGCYSEDQMQEYLDFYNNLPVGYAIMS